MLFLHAGTAAEHTVVAARLKTDHIEDFSVMIATLFAGNIFNFWGFLHDINYELFISQLTLDSIINTWTTQQKNGPAYSWNLSSSVMVYPYRGVKQKPQTRNRGSQVPASI